MSTLTASGEANAVRIVIPRWIEILYFCHECESVVIRSAGTRSVSGVNRVQRGTFDEHRTQTPPSVSHMCQTDRDQRGSYLGIETQNEKPKHEQSHSSDPKTHVSAEPLNS